MELILVTSRRMHMQDQGGGSWNHVAIWVDAFHGRQERVKSPFCAKCGTMRWMDEPRGCKT